MGLKIVGGTRHIPCVRSRCSVSGMGIPVLFRENTKSKNYDESRANYEQKEGKKVKRYTSDGKPVYE